MTFKFPLFLCLLSNAINLLNLFLLLSFISFVCPGPVTLCVSAFQPQSDHKSDRRSEGVCTLAALLVVVHPFIFQHVWNMK